MTYYIGCWIIKTGPQCWELLALDDNKASAEIGLETFQNDDPGGTYFVGPTSELPAGNPNPQVGDLHYPNGYNVGEPPCWIKMKNQERTIWAFALVAEHNNGTANSTVWACSSFSLDEALEMAQAEAKKHYPKSAGYHTWQTPKCDIFKRVIEITAESYGMRYPENKIES